MSYKKYKWSVVGSDFNSTFIRSYIWVSSFYNHPKIFKVTRPVMGIYSEKNTMKYMADLGTWTKTHEDLKGLVAKDNRYLDKLIDETNKFGEKLNKWTNTHLFEAELSKISNKKLFSLLLGFVRRQSMMYSYGILLPILDFQGYSFVESNLKKFLSEKAPAGKYAEYYQVFTEPVKNSFAQDQEEDLLKLMKEFYKPEWVQDVQKLSLDEVRKKYPKFYKKLQNHTAKHGWVYYVYAGPAFNEEQFLDFIKNYLKKGVNPTAKLAEFKTDRKKTNELKKKYLAVLKPDKFNLLILNLAGKVVWAKPRRKDYQSKSYYHSEKLMTEIGRRLGLNLAEARSVPIHMLENCLINNKQPDKKPVNSILDVHACLPNDDGEITILSGEEAKKFYENSVAKGAEEDKNEVKEVKGNPACVGKVRGKVKIINVPADMGKMNDGDILISTATTPSVVPAMKKAAAIVTDEGGLTCHAAIVSRELKIPCIVGTKIVTKVFKDGDEVEVDAEKGIVKILEKNGK